jgi:hypothetical protein
MSASGAFSTSVRRFIISSVIGGSLVAVVDSQPEPHRGTADDRRKPLARYGAIESALRERLAPSGYTTRRDTTHGGGDPSFERHHSAGAS